VNTTIDIAHGPATPGVYGKFVHVDHRRFLVRGVAYGAFAPRADGYNFPERRLIDRDFHLMAGAGINTVRTYTTPPLDLLDLAGDHGLRVMAGLAWSQHVAFLDDRHLRRTIRREIGARARGIADHPALLLTALGNEIPPPVVRWHGRRRIERFLADLFDEARDRAPDMLLTYVNYPPTEFLELPFVDVHAVNLYLHDEDAMRAYVRRLQHRAGHKPLLLAECGADSQRHGEGGQADLAAMHVRAALGEGACGAVVFSWTDEWWRGGAQVDDWSFGLVDRERRPKRAYGAIAGIFGNDVFPEHVRAEWPMVSIVVCARNAASTLDDCLRAIARVDYPSVEAIVVDDGSTDTTAEIAGGFPNVRLMRIPGSGLSVARNIGARAASGEIVAYVDADVRVEPDWLNYLVQPFLRGDAVAVGGPNRVPPDDDWFAQCVARAPGGPTHVLLDDTVAEHVPGCNLAIRRQALLEIGGFDRIFLRAGDDVDVCWRLQDCGGRIEFAPSAHVWHHHRSHLLAYWRQQVGYGEGEAWLRERHPHRSLGSAVSWRGRIYSSLPFVRELTSIRVNSGVWGTAAFPSIYHQSRHPVATMPHATPWVIGNLALVLGGSLGLLPDGPNPVAWLAVALGVLALAITLSRTFTFADQEDIDGLPRIGGLDKHTSRAVYKLTIAALHVVQPLARSFGWMRGVMRPATERGYRAGHLQPRRDVSADAKLATAAVGSPWALLVGSTYECRFWSEAWTSAERLLPRIVDRLRLHNFGREIQIDDGWCDARDVSVAVGIWAWVHLQALVEEHGAGRCLFRARVRLRPRPVTTATLAAVVASVVSILYVGGGAFAEVTLLGGAGAMVMVAGVTSRDARRILELVAHVARREGMQPIEQKPRRDDGRAPGRRRAIPGFTHGQ
jgi:GT2 family glycosyltransferase